MKFFLDNNMPLKLAAVLRAMELEVVHLRDHYGVLIASVDVLKPDALAHSR